jgi:hypothetical protein
MERPASDHAKHQPHKSEKNPTQHIAEIMPAEGNAAKPDERNQEGGQCQG